MENIRSILDQLKIPMTDIIKAKVFMKVTMIQFRICLTSPKLMPFMEATSLHKAIRQGLLQLLPTFLSHHQCRWRSVQLTHIELSRLNFDIKLRSFITYINPIYLILSQNHPHKNLFIFNHQHFQVIFVTFLTQHLDSVYL